MKGDPAEKLLPELMQKRFYPWRCASTLRVVLSGLHGITLSWTDSTYINSSRELRAVRFMIRLFCDRLGLTCGHSHGKKLDGQKRTQGTLEHAWKRTICDASRPRHERGGDARWPPCSGQRLWHRGDDATNDRGTSRQNIEGKQNDSGGACFAEPAARLERNKSTALNSAKPITTTLAWCWSQLQRIACRVWPPCPRPSRW